MIHVSMDGSRVNWSFFDMLKGKLECERDDPILLDFGSCELHESMLLFKLVPELMDLK